MQRKARSAVDDIDLAAAIAAALQSELHAPDITVDVSHGAVILEGKVEKQQQREAAESIARRFCSDVTNAVCVSRAGPSTV